MSERPIGTPDWLDPLLDALDDADRLAASVALRPGVGARPAAVLMLIGDGQRGPEILFVERAAGLRTHAGQIAFPGGAAEPNDADLAATALREAAEETGLDPAGVRVPPKVKDNRYVDIDPASAGMAARMARLSGSG